MIVIIVITAASTAVTAVTVPINVTINFIYVIFVCISVRLLDTFSFLWFMILSFSMITLL